MREMCLIYDFNIKHFTFQASNKGKHIEKSKTKEYVLENYFIENSKISRNVIRKYLNRFNLLDYKCAFCGNEGIWNNQVIALELDHKNGINNDDRLENLRWLCPNCHATTDTYRGRNVKNNNIKNEIVLKSKVRKKRKTSNCKRCGKTIHYGCNYCTECVHFLQRHADRPTRELLKEFIRNKSFREIGRMYNVTDNTIRKWCLSYDLPSKKNIIKNINDIDWNKI